MNNINFIESVTERDIDLLILEELSVSSDFFQWIIEKSINIPEISFIGVWHSLCNAEFGESDIVLLFQSKSKKVALLIENKIDAIPQPEQAERYHKRGEIGVKDKKWDIFNTCLVAPENYLSTTQNTELYDYQISYEDIEKWFKKKSDDKRFKYKSKILQEAIEQNRRGYTSVPNKRVSEFWLRYWETTQKIAPDLEMKRPAKKPSQSSWIKFIPSKLPEKMRILHKLEKGYVDLELSGTAEKAEQIVNKLQGIIPENMTIAITGKSIAIRKELDSINHFAEFDEEKEKVIQGIEFAKDLLGFADNVQKLL